MYYITNLSSTGHARVFDTADCTFETIGKEEIKKLISMRYNLVQDETIDMVDLLDSFDDRAFYNKLNHILGKFEKQNLIQGNMLYRYAGEDASLACMVLKDTVTLFLVYCDRGTMCGKFAFKTEKFEHNIVKLRASKVGNCKFAIKVQYQNGIRSEKWVDFENYFSTMGWKL